MNNTEQANVYLRNAQDAMTEGGGDPQAAAVWTAMAQVCMMGTISVQFNRMSDNLGKIAKAINQGRSWL